MILNFQTREYKMLDIFKFRAWDKVKNRMVEVAIYNGDLMGCYQQENYYHKLDKQEDRYIIMQSTGVHTMGNKLLYAGDLIRSPYDMELIKLVYWNQKETRFMCYMNDFMQCGLYQDDITKYKFEIVGNIFENWNWFRESKAEIDKIIDKYIWERWKKSLGGEKQ